LEHVQREDVAVALLDPRLPDLSGTQLLEKLRALNDRISVVINTTHGSLGSAKDAVNLGPLAYGEKAGDPDELLRQVHRAFRAHYERYITGLEAVTAERTGALREANQVLRREISVCRRAEEALREAEAKHREVVSSVPGALFQAVVKPDGSVRIPFLSEGSSELTGWTPEDIAPQAFNPWDVVAPEDVAALRREVSEARQGLRPISHELRVKTKSGGLQWIRVSAAPHSLENNDVAMNGVALDVTEYKRAEEALRESEFRLRQLAENIREVFWMANPERTRMRYVSPAYEQLWGRSCESLYKRPRSSLDAILPEDRERAICTFGMQARGEPIDVEYRIKQLDGSIRWIRSRGFPVRNAHGELYRVAGIAEDVTERKRAEETLRESEARYRQLFTTVSDAIVVFDADTKQFVDTNDAALHLYGYSRRELLKLGQPDITAEPAEFAASIRQTLAGQLTRIPLR
jgi:PAS domain S-box-containing protein